MLYTLRKNLLSIFNNLHRVFAAVIITARSVTSALSRTSETSEAYESGRNVFSMIKDFNNSPLQKSDNKIMVGTYVQLNHWL